MKSSSQIELLSKSRAARATPTRARPSPTRARPTRSAKTSLESTKKIHRKFTSKIKSARALAALLKKARKTRPGKSEKIVFTNGCFDLLHKGHVTYLELARQLGGGLIVALNTDASVKRLGKGDERPINPLADRLEVIAALESVDYVTWFDQDTPLEIIREIHPDILVKGGDWKPEQIVGSVDVIGWGGKVKSLAYVPGRSTTEIIAKAKKAK